MCSVNLVLNPTLSQKRCAVLQRMSSMESAQIISVYLQAMQDNDLRVGKFAYFLLYLTLNLPKEVGENIDNMSSLNLIDAAILWKKWFKEIKPYIQVDDNNAIIDTRTGKSITLDAQEYYKKNRNEDGVSISN